jgi:exopolyphosphatase / guanosine-5'-triphosphate,3'-diphosphate pyrophosphatase
VIMKKEKKGLEAVRALARELDPEPEHAFQVCKTALSIFDLTLELHGCGARERELLEAAALLHDTGYRTSAKAHHKHSMDIILGLDLPGFNESERKMLACIARYHRKALPDAEHRVYCELTAKAQGTVQRLASILRIADGLDRSHANSAESVHVVQEKSALCLYVKQCRISLMDISAGQNKTDLFEQVFKLRVEVLPEQMSEK